MARTRRRGTVPTGLSDLLILDADGVSKAADGDPFVQAWLERARELDADIIVSAVTLAEALRGAARDAARNRVLKATDIWPADEKLGRRAGDLLGRAALDATIDALVVATALAAREKHHAARCVILTSDPDDLRRLLADAPEIRVVPG